jgi:hypothetical protein
MDRTEKNSVGSCEWEIPVYIIADIQYGNKGTEPEPEHTLLGLLDCRDSDTIDGRAIPKKQGIC